MLPSASDSELQLTMFWYARQVWVLNWHWLFNFSFVGHLLGFISVGNVSANSRGWWSYLQGKTAAVHSVKFWRCCCCLFACLFSFFLLSSVWLNRSHLSVFSMISYPLHKLGVTSGTRHGDPHGRFKCERVKYTFIYFYYFFLWQMMESKLLVGGKSIVDTTTEQERALEERRREIAEQHVSYYFSWSFSQWIYFTENPLRFCFFQLMRTCIISTSLIITQSL